MVCLAGSPVFIKKVAKLKNHLRPTTPGGFLLRMLIEIGETMSKITGLRNKYQDTCGSKPVNICNQDLGNGLHCERKPFPPYDSNKPEKRPNCSAKNLIYMLCRQ